MPLLTIVAKIETNAYTECIVKGALWYATKVYNGLLWHIRQGNCKPSRKDLNACLKLLPACKAYYSHSTQATRDEVIQAHKSFMALKAKGYTQHQQPSFRPKNSYSPLRYHNGFGFTLEDDVLTISLGTKRDDGIKHLDLKLAMRKDITFTKVINVVLTYDKNNGLCAHLVVYINACQPLGSRTVAVDLGETYLITAVFDDGTALLYKGMFVKSIRRYWQKVRASLKPPSKGKRKSKRFAQVAHKEEGQIDHMLHMITKHFVMQCYNSSVDTIVVGDVTGIRERIDWGHRLNQRLHAWAYAKIKHMITYKAACLGIKVITVNEAYTSKTCYACGKVSKSQRKGRGWYKCTCGWQMQADCNGALNILKKYVSLSNESSGHVASPVVLQSKSFNLDWHMIYESHLHLH